jgi:threonyl-tRNA synthetase
VRIDEPDGLMVLRHSCAHVLAQAVQQVNPDAKLGIGPPIRDGFYYDFDVATPFTPEDLKSLEKVMQRIINEGQTFHRREVSDEDALVELAGEPYKCELIGLKGGADACRGRRRRCRRRGRRRPADDLRQRAPRRQPRLGRPVPRPAHPQRPSCSATPSR